MLAYICECWALASRCIFDSWVDCRMRNGRGTGAGALGNKRQRRKQSIRCESFNCEQKAHFNGHGRELSFECFIWLVQASSMLLAYFDVEFGLFQILLPDVYFDMKFGLFQFLLPLVYFVILNL